MQGCVEYFVVGIQGNHSEQSVVALTRYFYLLQALQAQILEDDAVRDLAESLREMVALANSCPDLLRIAQSTDVIKEMGRTVVEVASVIDEYASPSFWGE
jgi:predicted RNase H-like nuclease (RuvC/YqgF family)